MPRLLAATLAAAFALSAAPAAAHEGDPNFRSDVLAVTPSTEGIAVEVLNRDDRLLLTNRSDSTVLIEGYSEEPYARLHPDGTVEVNRVSPATYLNEERYGQVPVPEGADGRGAPRWETVSKTGRFEWHDHRIHWMGKGVPPAVRDASETQKVTDWVVPIAIDGRRGEITGELWWTPQAGGGPPLAALVALALVAGVGGAVVLVVRRRRLVDGGRAPGAEREAW